MQFIIWSLEYAEHIGGIVVLHKLGKTLSDLGYKVFLISSKTLSNSGCKLINTNEAFVLSKQKESVVIYPEIVKGNPLDCQKVVRWILYKPGFIGGETTFNAQELIFTFSKFFVSQTIYQSVPELSVIDSNIEKFQNKGLERSGICFLLKKGKYKLTEQNHLNRYILPFLKDTSFLQAEDLILDYQLSKPNLNVFLSDYFNKFKIFVSLDTSSYHSVQAALCGCVSVVIPDVEITREDWIEKQPLMKFGVAYGFGDIIHSTKTLSLVRDGIIHYEKNSLNTINNFLTLIKNKWFN